MSENRKIVTTDQGRMTASETKSMDVVVSTPPVPTAEPVAPSADPGSGGTPPADVND